MSAHATGVIALDRTPSDKALLPAAMEAIEAAFDVSPARGVLHLALFQLDTPLSPGVDFWRELGKQFVSQACASLDPTEPETFVSPTPEPTRLEELAASVPPMTGAELMSPALLADVWEALGSTLRQEATRFGGVASFLAEHSPVWHAVGRVCVHLAENKKNPDYPFAFLATYAHRISDQQRPQHLPLARALKEYHGDADKLKPLLTPLLRAARSSALLHELIDSRDIYRPLAWTPGQAHQFLSEVELYQRAGLVVRVPDWWRRRPRPRVSVRVGTEPPSTLGIAGLLDFDISLTLDGEPLEPEEITSLLEGTEGLALIKGKWVEVDGKALGAVLDQWRTAEQLHSDGIRFGDAMRMLAGLDNEAPKDAIPSVGSDWSNVVAGPWLRERLEGLARPAVDEEIDHGAGLDAELRPYQKVGVQWLWTLRSLELGACLADDMGLGKTIQVLGVLSMSRQRQEPGTDLLVVPASLLDNWRIEFERFAPHLTVLVAHSSAIGRTALAALGPEQAEAHDAVVTTYGTVLRSTWMKEHSWRAVILDEAQAIKNPAAKQTRAVKSLSSRWRLALTGTPVENRLGDLWSLFDFLNPGLLGSAQSFSRLCKAMARGRGYGPLRRVTQPYILRRLKTDKRVICDLPDKTEVTAWCLLSKRQAALYSQAVDEMKQLLSEAEGMKRRGIVLSFLMRFKQICNHPSHWLGDGVYNTADSGKFRRLVEIGQTIASRQDKALVFTQFRELCDPLLELLRGVFESPGLVLHGGTPVKKRHALVHRFQEDDSVPFMVLSLKAGGVGLNLTAASHVIHFDRWWNPAVENQATDRAFRIGQRNNVLVHKFVCSGTLEERIDDLVASKQKLSDEVLSAGAEARLTELSNDELLSMVSLDLERTME